jgi:hypothetical protein
MSYKRLTLTFTPDEMSALREVARREYRNPRDQAKYLLLVALGQADRTDGDTKGKTAGRSLATNPGGLGGDKDTVPCLTV